MQVSSSTGEYMLPETRKQPAKTLDKDAFLQLFITQLKYQDPMSPMDSDQFMAQMTQFSILEQLTNLSQELSQLSRSQKVLEASSLVGRQVSVFTEDGTVSGTVEKVNFSGQDILVFVNGKAYDISLVIEVHKDGGTEQVMARLDQLIDKIVENNNPQAEEDPLAEILTSDGQ